MTKMTTERKAELYYGLLGWVLDHCADTIDYVDALRRSGHNQDEILDELMDLGYKEDVSKRLIEAARIFREM